MLKPALQLKLGQQLTMTPQLQQAIRLLQLPVLELQAQIREALESNVMLEAEDEAASLETGEVEAGQQFEATAPSAPSASRTSTSPTSRTGATRRSPARRKLPGPAMTSTPRISPTRAAKPCRST